jgi:predicted aldo/keto reductase-like oxidoreductase
MDDVEEICAPGGALETFVKARESGKIRNIGFSAHSEEAALALMEQFKFDSVLFPVNFVCYSSGNFGPRVVQQAEKTNVSRLALKMLAYSPWPEGMDRSQWPKCWYRPVEDEKTTIEAMRFTLSEPVTAAIPPGEAELYLKALELAPRIKMLLPDERSQLLASVSDVDPLFRS